MSVLVEENYVGLLSRRDFVVSCGCIVFALLCRNSYDDSTGKRLGREMGDYQRVRLPWYAARKNVDGYKYQPTYQQETSTILRGDFLIVE